MLWALGPFVVPPLALNLSGPGVCGIRIVFAHLLVVSLLLWVLRARLPEFRDWERATAVRPVTPTNVPQALRRSASTPLLLLTSMYRLWNAAVGTASFFSPYIMRTVGAQTQTQSHI